MPEGKLKAVNSMFDNMTPLLKIHDSGTEDDDDDGDGSKKKGKKNKGKGKPKEKGKPRTPKVLSEEAGHPVYLPDLTSCFSLNFLTGESRKEKENGLGQSHQSV